MKTKRHLLQVCLLSAALLPAAVQAQFTFTIKNDAVTITGYTGPGGVVTIPSTTNGYPVTSIADSVFQNKSSVTSVIIPDSVTNVGNSTFNYCTGLTNISIGSSVASIGNSMFFSCYRLVSMAIPNSVNNIGTNAFFECTSLTNISIPTSVTNIADMAFFECSGLKGIYFHGNAPSIGSSIFFDDNNTTAYYLPGTTGWPTFDANSGLKPAVLWNPQAQTSDGSFGVQANQFGFNITGQSIFPLWWKLARTWEASGLLCKPAPSQTVQSISAIRSGRITRPFYRIRSP